MFLYGIRLMEQVTKRIAGRSFKLFLRQHTGNLAKAIFGGTIITGLIQSSSVVILMLMSFVEAGVISFRNALGLLIGSNLGTTADSWFIATVGFKFNLQAYSLPIIAITGLIMFFTEKRRQLYDSLYFIFSMGILLLGFGFMKEAAEQLVLKFDIASYAGYNLFFILIIGFFLTVLIQSSAATVAIALTALHAHALAFPAAACLIIGSELGTTIKIVFGSLRGNAESKMLAWGDFFFNLITVIFSFSLLSWIIIFIREIVGIKDPLIGLVFFQSFINLMSIILFLPFIRLFSHWLAKMFHKKKQVSTDSFNIQIPVIPKLAPVVLHKAGMNILQRVLKFHSKIFGLEVPSHSNILWNKIKTFTRIHGTTDNEYFLIKETEGDVLKYYIALQKDELTKEEYENINRTILAVRQTIHAAKSVYDIKHNLRTFHSSGNNYLFHVYTLFREEWQVFETDCSRLLTEKNEDELRMAVESSMKLAFKQFEANKCSIEKPLEYQKLDKMEASTLLNVYHEILSSKKALLRAVALLNLKETIPGKTGENFI